MYDSVLVLADGRYFVGESFGKHSAEGSMGEVVFNTSLSGYQEIITDPSYKGQMVCFTFPSIGNYGINQEDNQSKGIYLKAVIAKDYCRHPSNFRSQMTLHDFLWQKKIPAISGVDTRALVKHIREQGSMSGGIFLLTKEEKISKQVKVFLKRIKEQPALEDKNLTYEFDGKAANDFVQELISTHSIETTNFKKVLVLDFGIKFSILKNLLQNNILPFVVGGNIPYNQWHISQTAIDDIDGIFISNGPGDPAMVTEGIKNTKYLLSLDKPIFGICLGHQLLSLAQGGKTFKLKFGHHGGNQPIKSVDSKKIHITAQNHNFAVDEKSMQSSQDKTNQLFYNLNDQTFAGYVLPEQKILSVQYHPEASPGPRDMQSLFTHFYKMLK